MSYRLTGTITRETPDDSRAPRFEVDSYGNGAAYTFRRFTGEDSDSIWVEGDDAARFREEHDAVLARDTLPGGKGPLAWLWDECSWGDAATADPRL